MKFKFNDGGRAAAGLPHRAKGECVTRAIAIATGLPYAEVYAALSEGCLTERKGKRGRKFTDASRGVHTNRKWFNDYIESLGWVWVPTMKIGSGCKVHLHGDELPMGRLIVSVSKHVCAVIDRVIHDTYDPRREAHVVEPDTGRALKAGEWRNENGICRVARRCVYGYWMRKEAL